MRLFSSSAASACAAAAKQCANIDIHKQILIRSFTNSAVINNNNNIGSLSLRENDRTKRRAVDFSNSRGGGGLNMRNSTPHKAMQTSLKSKQGNFSNQFNFDGPENQKKVTKFEVNAFRYACREITYFMTGKKDGTLDDYLSLTDEDIFKECSYLLPNRFGGSIYGRHQFSYSRKDANAQKKTSLAYFTGTAHFFEALYQVEKAWIDTLQNGSPNSSLYQNNNQMEKTYSWMKQEQLESAIGGKIRLTQYSEIISYLNAIASHAYGRQKHETLLASFSRKKQTTEQKRKKDTMDEFGRIRAIGSHKLSKCAIYLTPGTGVVTVNERPLARYFSKLSDRQRVIDPFMACGAIGEFDVDVKVDGGGTTGQSSAIRLAITRALYGYNEHRYAPLLDEYDLFIRDPRHKERKKPGWAKARKKRQWVKR